MNETSRRRFGATLLGALAGAAALLSGKKSAAQSIDTMFRSVPGGIPTYGSYGYIALPQMPTAAASRLTRGEVRVYRDSAIGDLEARGAARSLAELRREADALKASLGDARVAVRALRGKE